MLRVNFLSSNTCLPWSPVYILAFRRTSLCCFTYIITYSIEFVMSFFKIYIYIYIYFSVFKQTRTTWQGTRWTLIWVHLATEVPSFAVPTVVLAQECLFLDSYAAFSINSNTVFRAVSELCCLHTEDASCPWFKFVYVQFCNPLIVPLPSCLL